MHYIDQGRGANKPSVVRRWFVELSDYHLAEPPHPRAAEYLQKIIRMAPFVLRSKYVDVRRIEKGNLGAPDKDRLRPVVEASTVAIVVIGDLDGDGPLTVLDGRQRVWALMLANSSKLRNTDIPITIRAVSIRGSDRLYRRRQR